MTRNGYYCKKIHHVSSCACCLTNNAKSNCLPLWPTIYELMGFFYWRCVIYHCFWCAIWVNVSVNHICNLAVHVPKEYPLSHCFLMIQVKTVLTFFSLTWTIKLLFPSSSLIFLLLADALKFNKSVACGNVCFIVLEIGGLNLSSTFSQNKYGISLESDPAVLPKLPWNPAVALFDSTLFFIKKILQIIHFGIQTLLLFKDFFFSDSAMPVFLQVCVPFFFSSQRCNVCNVLGG